MTEWQPIETAPRCRQILVFAEGRKSDDFAIFNALFDEDGIWYAYTADFREGMVDMCWYPTHWMPLPEPPA